MCIANMTQTPAQSPGVANLQAQSGGQGLAPYGFRHEDRAGAPISVKGKGYYGGLRTSEGDVATEISVHDKEGRGHPLLVPTLTKEERQRLLDGKKPTDEIYDKAEAWADKRRKQGKSPFASPTELRIPAR